MKINGISDQARKLHSALIQRGVNAEIEKYDGHKHIDLAVVKAKLNIEIDEDRHYLTTSQIETDLARDNYSTEEGYDTFRVPARILEEKLDEVADAIVKVVAGRIGFDTF